MLCDGTLCDSVFFFLSCFLYGSLKTQRLGEGPAFEKVFATVMVATHESAPKICSPEAETKQ